MPTHGPLTAQPTCPRCGYDQSGAVATWTDRCPLGGTCPECGTRFEWADLFDPARRDIRWFVEHAAGVWSMVRRTTPTLWRMGAPWVFWSRVGVHARTEPRRLAWWLLGFAVVVHAAAWLPVSLLFAAFDAGYGLSPGDLLNFLKSTPRSQLLDALLHGLGWPAFSTLAGGFSWNGYYGGEELWRVARMHLGIGLTWFGVLAALPVTRRLARLRRAHLLRALLLHAAVVVVAFEFARVVFPINWVYGGFGPAAALLLAYAGVWAWSLVWWGVALRIGWGVRSWSLLILGTFAAAVGGLVFMTIEDSVSYLMWMAGG